MSQDHRHQTGDCNDLKWEIKMWVQNSQLSQFVKGLRKTDYRRDQEDSRGRDKQYEYTQS